MTVSERPPWMPRKLPSAPPEWITTFDAFTDKPTSDLWGRRAAELIAQRRTDTGTGPTFRELFILLIPDTNGRPSPLPKTMDRNTQLATLAAFRWHVALHWRRERWIRFTNEPRSLRPGARYRPSTRDRATSAHDGLE